MDKTPLFQQIAEAVRQEILLGRLAAGESLPSVREMAQRWRCTPGTAQRAYRELGRQGLVVSRPGQGTRVAGGLAAANAAEGSPSLRQASLIHRAEAFLLEALAAGHRPEAVEQALRAALDRWRSLSSQAQPVDARVLRFMGSHDPALSLIAARFGEIAPDYRLDLRFSGSLGGLMALAQGEADLAGVHLWDGDSEDYNVPFVRRLLPGRRVALLTLAHRRLGLILPAGNPAGVEGLADLARPGLRFVNRQQGAGTRVWLDSQLQDLAIDPAQVAGYGREESTHSAVAQAVAERQADAGLGVEAAALAHGLDFRLLARERYELAALAPAMEYAPLQSLATWLTGEPARSAIADLGGYDTVETGEVRWVSA